MSESRSHPEFSRNYGFWSKSEQEAMSEKVVAIAGCGGDGHDLGIAIAMMSGPKEIRIADPEVFEPENSNRVAWADETTYGRMKVDVMAETIAKLRPQTQVKIWREGVTAENAEEFVGGADIVLDESELTHLEIGTAVAREARKNGIPNLLVMNIGFAAIATSFDPHARYTFERMMGVSDDMPLDEVADVPVDFSRCLPYIPSYGDLTTLRAVEQGASLPSVVQGVKVASAIGSTEAFLHMTREVGNRRPSPTFAPRWRYMDALTGDSGVIRHGRLNYAVRAANMAVRSKLGLNPRASYSAFDREDRQA